jgi:hypothetical protein
VERALESAAQAKNVISRAIGGQCGDAFVAMLGAATSYGEALGHGSHPLSEGSQQTLNRAGALLSDAGEKLYAKCIVKR